MRNLPPVVKNLIILNAILLAAKYLVSSFYQVDLDDLLGYYMIGSTKFKPFQLVTYMFMHGDFFHLLFNMYALFLFGVMLEHVWGGKKFFIYYILCGLGAILFNTLVNYIEISFITNEFNALASSFTPETFAGFVRDHFPSFEYTPGSGELINYQALFDQLIDMQKSIPTVGASGAVYGILLAFGMTFPDLQLMLLFPPIPIKAKWLVVIYGGLELVFGLTQPGSSIAHFAHLGGMLIGFILIKLWAKKNHGSNF